jgi:N-acetylmuramoyl-L-alanine amidase
VKRALQTLALLLLSLPPLLWAAGEPQARAMSLERSGQSRVLELVEAPGGASLPLKEAALAAGAVVTWQSSSHCLLLEARGHAYRLVLHQPWVYVDAQERLPLPYGFCMQAGRPVLDVESLQALLNVMGAGPQAPAGQAVTMRAYVAPEPALPSPMPTPTAQAAPAIKPAKEPAGKPVRKIIIDPGHGGFDSGALGHHGGKEKDACLDIGVRLRELLRSRLPGVKVLMTRDHDVFVELKERTRFANRQDADLFVSIHANSSPNSSSHGTQVFFYDSQSSNKDAEVLARSENEDANYLDIMLTDLSKTAVRDQSIDLAMKVEAELVKRLGLKGRHLQYAPFYVLAKTKMPAILVETAFISNAQEERLLGTSAWRDQMAKAIGTGVMAYIREAGE